AHDATTRFGPLESSEGLPPGQLTVMLFHLPETPNHEAAFAAIRSSKADVVLLQGVTADWREELYWQVAPFRVSHLAVRPGRDGLAILTRVRVGEINRIRLSAVTQYLLPTSGRPVIAADMT